MGVVLLVAFLSACGTSRPPAPSPNVGTILPVGHTAPDVPLLDQNGRPTALSSFRGKYVVMAEFLTLCQEECPITTGAFQLMQQAVRRAGLASKVAFVEITLDPGRDTPARLLAYQQEFGADWTLLTGTPDNIAALWKHLGVYDQKVPEGTPPAVDWWTHQPLTYDIDHSNGFFLFDPAGNERFLTQEMPNLHGQLSPQLKSLLDGQGMTNLDTADPGNSYTVPQAVGALSWLVGKKLKSPVS